MANERTVRKAVIAALGGTGSTINERAYDKTLTAALVALEARVALNDAKVSA